MDRGNLGSCLHLDVSLDCSTASKGEKNTRWSSGWRGEQYANVTVIGGRGHRVCIQNSMRGER